jgi:hypothetical protein
VADGIKMPFREWLKIQTWPRGKFMRNLVAFLSKTSRPDDNDNWKNEFVTLLKTGENNPITKQML